MNGTHLTGLQGTNPLAFFAALGVQVLFTEEQEQPRLWWTDDTVPHAVVDAEFTVDRIVEQALQTFPKWKDSPALSPGFGGKAADDAKFDLQGIRRYLEESVDGGPVSVLSSALVAEGCLDTSKGVMAKPSDLYFTSGNQRFLAVARDILAEANEENLIEGLVGPWGYASKSRSLMWDVTDDRVYALSFADPTDGTLNPKLTNPGPEALAVFGLSRHPVFAGTDRRGRDRTLTRGCAGPWRRDGTYTWPLWSRPAGYGAVGSLLAQATSTNEKQITARSRWYRAWSIFRVMTATIRRSDQGAYGTFAPPEIIWSATEAA